MEGWGEETREKCKETFWFLHTRVRERVRGAFLCFTTQSERTRQFQVTTRSARAKWVRAKANTSPPICTFSKIVRSCLGASRLGMVFPRDNPSIFEGKRKRPLGNAEVRTNLFEKIPNPFGIFLLSVFFDLVGFF